MEKKDIALEYFYNGNNCAQSVLKSFQQEIGINEDVLVKISSGFGGGIGKQQHVCGAVTGACMAIGMIYSNGKTDNDSKDYINGLIRKFTQEFNARINSVYCNELLGVDLMTEQGQEDFDKFHLKDEVCAKCVIESVEILNDMLNEENQIKIA